MATFQIKKEELDIAKEWLQTGEVNIYRETFTEEKTFTVPVKREELVIRKKVLVSADSEIKNMPTEIIRIPLSEEHVEFTKQKVNLEEVSIYKQQIQDIKHIEETLKRESLKVKISDSLKFLGNSKHS
ncbi:YsnF/AvaK domain-containing protein [Clostridium estertheticum]|uniref:YsnF/AvaK domain-containing protein n=1 Tax=Clostridium estertheticum TaxID=238834 RepID=A0A5N7IX94_9CLOT|nr:YsnF/AvaK domain-containing protein [Clostridium estertheticum]MPQ30416.1 YsnF/AvaK domain-containing protein [Clostridium estertheticum]MPQ61092.1 YsnF/AvaK domain-containing protein [Clostridium estertheticum]